MVLKHPESQALLEAFVITRVWLAPHGQGLGGMRLEQQRAPKSQI